MKPVVRYHLNPPVMIRGRAIAVVFGDELRPAGRAQAGAGKTTVLAAYDRDGREIAAMLQLVGQSLTIGLLDARRAVVVPESDLPVVVADRAKVPSASDGG